MTDRSPFRTCTALAAAAALAASGCSTFQPAAGPAAAGDHVRAHLTPEGQVRQATATGAARASIEGDVLAVEPDALLLVAPIPGIVEEYHRSPKVADTLRVPLADVTGIDVQRFSGLRSGLLVGGVMALGAVGVLWAGHAASPDGGPTDPTYRNALRPAIPIVSIPVGW